VQSNTSQIASFLKGPTEGISDLPTEKQQIEVVRELRKLVSSGTLGFKVKEVSQNERPPWCLGQTFIDVELTYEEFTMYGSGVGPDLLTATIHAFCESLERLLFKCGLMEPGTLGFELTTHRFVRLNFDALSPDPKVNPCWLPSGQAIHTSSQFALHAAMSEMFERGAICGARNDLKFFQLADSCVLGIAEVLPLFQYFSDCGYDFRLYLNCNFAGFYTAVAASKKRNGTFPISFRGSGTSLNLNAAIRQAASEVGRSFWFGKHSLLTSSEAAKGEQLKFPIEDYHYGMLERLTAGDWFWDLDAEVVSMSSFVSLSNAPVNLNVVFQSQEAPKPIFFVPYNFPSSLSPLRNFLCGWRCVSPGYNQHINSVSK
jgi:YcaO cyclodehydratase, ATP-ad Mg2+-binding